MQSCFDRIDATLFQTLEMKMSSRTVWPRRGGGHIPPPVDAGGFSKKRGQLTVTVPVASGTFGNALAWMVAVPGPTPVTSTLALLAPAGMVTCDVTVATAALLELRWITKPEGLGAGAERIRKKCCVPVPVMVILPGEN